MSGAAGGFASTLAKWWLVPVIALSIVGADQLASDWSDNYTRGVGTAGGIAVEDGKELGEHFNHGREIAGGDAAPAPLAPAAPAPQPTP